MTSSDELETQRINLERYKVDLDRYKAELDAQKIRVDQWTTGFNGLITLSSLGIKSLILVNGGAVLALLTFIGNRVRAETPECFTWAFGAYLLGVGLALVCVLLAYIFQSVELETQKKKLAIALRLAAIVVAVLSLISFVTGSVYSIYGFSRLEQASESTPIVLPKPAPNHPTAAPPKS